MHTEMNNTDEEKDKRILSDRRACPTPIISRYTFFGGQRKAIRREEDKKKYLFVDLYSTRLLIVVISLLILSCLDAYLTLTLIEKGRVVEANPLMAFFLDYGILPFTIIKFVITALSLTILCLLKNVYTTRICLPIAIKIYLLVIAYELYLFVII